MLTACPPTPQVFDDSHYAANFVRKLRRAVQLGLKYYAWDLPRYFAHRRALGLLPWDFAAFVNPVREFRSPPPSPFELPPAYPEALHRLHEAGVRLVLPRARLEALLGLWWETRAVPGDAIECGSFRGGTALTLALLGHLHQVPQAVLLLDTFTGAPATCRYDLARSPGEFAPSGGQVETIRRQAAALGISARVQVHPGLFAATFATLSAGDPRFTFVHVDANLYQSTLDACAFTLPRTLPGGAVVFDDYNGVCDLGARLAIDHYFAGTGRQPLPLAGFSAYVRVGREGAAS